MCGRFVQATPGQVIAQVFGLGEVPELSPRYNIAPTQEAAVVRVEGDKRVLAFLRWGLVPSWAKDPTIGNRLINARAETLAEKPAFRRALVQRRCVIPATGFYEWRKLATGKQPYYFCLENGLPMAMAGLWERWEGEEGPPLETFAIITTPANELLAPIHDRMPALLSPVAMQLWLAPQLVDSQQLTALLAPAPAAWLRAYPVSRAVNNPAHDAPDCIAPVSSETPG
jgi:putative SOS response-associated peptidase YedK